MWASPAKMFFTHFKSSDGVNLAVEVEVVLHEEDHDSLLTV
jgi:hypothetical protein